MIRSLTIILLAIICGVAAAIGVSQMAPKPVASDAKTQTVFVASQAIRRGARISEEMVKSVPWPAGLVPGGVQPKKDEIIGRSALSSIKADEPFFRDKLSASEGNGFASNSIPKGMRACTIQTGGPAASVAGFVRPGDHVDVLLNLRGNANDETGGGSAITLLQAVKILAIDDIMDVDTGATVKMWIKEGLASVTLLVTPDQAVLLSLGQSSGSLSLALRNGDDTGESDPLPATIRQIREMQHLIEPIGDVAAAPNGGEAANNQTNDDRPSPPPVVRPGLNEEPPPPPATYIRTLRGTQSGQVRVVGVHEPNR